MGRNHKVKVVYEVRTRDGWRRAPEGVKRVADRWLRVTSEDGTSTLLEPWEFRIVPVAEEK